MFKMFIAVGAMLLLAGCGHNVNVHGIGFASPYGAFGSGTFSCVKDNVTVTSVELTKKDGDIETTHEFKVGDQATGYDVEIAKAKAGTVTADK